MEATRTIPPLCDVQDILFHITQHLDPDRSSDDEEEVARVRRTLLSAALAFRNFARPALNALWRSLPSDMPLIYLLCSLGIARQESFESLLDENRPRPPSLNFSELLLDNPLDPRADPNWARFREYAACVRHIRLKYNYDPIAARLSIWTEVSEIMPEEYILPLLQSVRFTGSTSDFSPSLGKFPPVFRLQAPESFRFPFANIITSIRSRPFAPLFLISPSVREFHLLFLGCVDDGREAEQALSDACVRAPNLETITFSIFPWGQNQNLSILHRNPHLRSISINTTVEIQNLEPLTHLLELEDLSVTPGRESRHTQNLIFPSLKRLSVRGRLDSARDLLELVEARRLKSLMLSAAQAGHSQQLLQLSHLCLKAITERFYRLETLSIRCTKIRSLFKARLSDQEPHTMSFMTVVEPLLSLHLLRHIVLGFDSFILQLSSDDVLSLSESWPAVEELHIDVATPKSGRAGFESLLHFARRCPRLRVLHLPVMDITPGTFEELEYPTEPHPLRDLGIKEVVFPLGMDFSREKTAFIRRVFPNVALAAPATFPTMS